MIRTRNDVFTLRKRRFELMTVRFNPDQRVSHAVAKSAEQAAGLLDVPEDDFCFVRVSENEGEVCWGEFELWCAGSRARARILEHREHDAVVEEASGHGEDVTFRDDDGTFTVPFGQTVPRSLAVAALRAWVKDRKHPPMLRWT